MNRRLVSALTLLAVFGSLTSTAWAETPQEAVQRVIDSMKKSGTLTPLVESTDWDSQFRAMSTSERAARGFNSAADMKAHFGNRVKANGADSVEKIEKDLKKQAGAETAENISLVREELTRQQADSRTRLSATSYLIVDTKQNADGTAVVTVRKTLDESDEEVQISLRPSGSGWLISNSGLLNPSPTRLNGGSPVGRLPEPAAVLGQP